jgi:hypothetical protein
MSRPYETRVLFETAAIAVGLLLFSYVLLVLVFCL